MYSLYYSIKSLSVEFIDRNVARVCDFYNRITLCLNCESYRVLRMGWLTLRISPFNKRGKVSAIDIIASLRCCSALRAAYAE